MDLAQAKSIVESAIARSSQNLIAKEIGIDAAALSRWLRGMTQPTGETKTNIIRFAEGAGVLLTGTRGRAARRPASPAVQDVIRAAQEEQVRWVREFAARVLEASARELRSLPDDITLEDIEGDERAAEELEEKVRQGKAALGKSKKGSKRATG